MEIQVQKRDGSWVAFDQGKIHKALVRCFDDIKEPIDSSALDKIVKRVVTLVRAEAKDSDNRLTVEQIQDTVELVLMTQKYHKAARHYVLYREEHTKLRVDKPISADVQVAFDADAAFFKSDLERFQHFDKYARFDPQLGRRETYRESVTRIIDHFRWAVAEKMPGAVVTDDEFKRLEEAMLLNKASPSMRIMQMAGPAARRCAMCGYNCLGVETKFITSDGVRTFADSYDGEQINVLTHTGKLKPAIVRNYGKQKLRTLVFKRGRQEVRIRATKDHRWLLKDGTETTNIKIGNKLLSAPTPTDTWNYDDLLPLERLAWAYGLVFADGTKVKHRNIYTHSMIRLCGDKAAYLERFEELGFTSSRPLSYGGDPVVYTGTYLKTLPSVSDPLPILTAFVQGWLAGDGSKTTGHTPSDYRSIQVTGDENIEFVRKVFPLVGFYITREEVITNTTNYGERSETTVCFGLVNRFGNASNSYFSLTEILDDETIEDVWCLDVEDDHSFVHPAGVVTGNCSYIAIDSLSAFSEGLYVLMQGTGLGFSVEREFIDDLPRVRKRVKSEPATFVVEDNTESWCDSLLFGLERWFAGEDVIYDYSKIRPAGTRLETKGGTASGPDPLCELHNFARSIIFSRAGRRLRPIDAHDIMCMIGFIVQVGGVRRAACISLSDLDDADMRASKFGAFWKDLSKKQRTMANNSAVYDVKPPVDLFLDEWLSLMRSFSGERGIFNRDGAFTTMPERRRKVLRAYHNGKCIATIGVNPCVTGDTWVHTTDGPQQIEDLVGKTPTVFVNGKPRQATRVWQTGTQPVFRVKLANGVVTRMTDNHKILVVKHQSNKVQRTEWRELNDVRVGDMVVLHNHRHARWSGYGTDDEGYLLGTLVGNGCFSDQSALLDFWGETRDYMTSQVVPMVKTAVGARSDCRGSDVKAASVGKTRISTTKLKILADEYNIGKSKRISREIERTSSEFHCGFIRGFFDTDGGVQGSQSKGLSLRASSVIRENLVIVQRMLLRLGINSTIYDGRQKAGTRSLPDGRGGYKDYPVKELFELVIANDNIQEYADRIGFMKPDKAEALTRGLDAYKREPNRDRFAERIVSIEPDGEEAVYDMTVPGAHAFDANGMYVHNCGEIRLISRQCCNLSISVVRPDDTLETLLEKVEIAAIFGTLQSGLTYFRYLPPEWSENCELERLLGVDLLGALDCHLLRAENPDRALILEQLKARVREVNKVWAAKLGIAESTATTCIKPGGNSSVRFGTGQSMSGWLTPYMIRNTEVSKLNPLHQLLVDEGVPHETSYRDSGTSVFSWPLPAPENAQIVSDLVVVNGQVNGTKPRRSAIDQLEDWLVFQEHWAEHSVSVTVYVADDEWLAVADWVYNHWEQVSGLSFLPLCGGVYPQAPYTPVTKEYFDEFVAKFPKINWAKLTRYETVDATNVGQEYACVGGACSI